MATRPDRPSAGGLPPWLVVGSLVEALLIAVFFLVPFSQLWTQLPAAPAPSDVKGAPSGDWSAPFAVAVMFGLPSLIPFALLARLPWGRRTHVSMSRGMTLAAVALILLPAADRKSTRLNSSHVAIS